LDTYQIEINNVTTRTVSISPSAILCELQPVTVLEITVLPEPVISYDIDVVFSKVNMSPDVCTEENQTCKDLIKSTWTFLARVPQTLEQLMRSDTG
jgi:hypothetical protein